MDHGLIVLGNVWWTIKNRALDGWRVIIEIYQDTMANLNSATLFIIHSKL